MDTDYNINYDPVADYYRALGIPPASSEEEIHQAYRERAKQVHPDRNRNRQAWAHAQFKQLNDIKDVLFDPALRAEYDRQRAAYLLSLFGEPQTQAHTRRWQTQPPQAQQWTRSSVDRFQRPTTWPSKLLGSLLFVFGMAVLVLGLGLGLSTMMEVGNSPSLSNPLTLDQIVAMHSLPSVALVKLSNLDCANLKTDTNKSEGFLPSEDQRTLAVIWFSSIRTCPEVERATIAGSIQPLDGGMYNKLVADGAFVKYPKAANFIYICENCGGSDPAGIAGITALFSILGLFAVCGGIYKLRIARKK